MLFYHFASLTAELRREIFGFRDLDVSLTRCSSAVIGLTCDVSLSWRSSAQSFHKEPSPADFPCLWVLSVLKVCLPLILN